MSNSIVIPPIKITESSFNLKEALKTKDGKIYHTREIILLSRYKKDFLGEVAPLIDYSLESISEAKDNLEDISSKLENKMIPTEFYLYLDFIEEFKSNHKMLPSVSFGIESFLSNLISKELNLPVHKWINPNSENSIKINHLLSGEINQIKTKLEFLKDKEVHALKLKLNSSLIEDNLKRIKLIRSYFSETELRLDPNEGIMGIDHIVEFLERASAYNITYIEDPILSKDLDKIKNLKEKSKIAFALDENLKFYENYNLINKTHTDFFIIKPQIIGGISECLKLIKSANLNNIQYIFTHCLEGKVGFSNALNIAKSFDQNMANGFDESYFQEKNN